MKSKNIISAIICIVIAVIFIGIMTFFVKQAFSKIATKMSFEENIKITETTTFETTTFETSTFEVSTETTTEEIVVDPDKVAEEFYKGSVFVGDSIMEGFHIFSTRKDVSTYLKNIKFYSCVNYTVKDAVSPINKDNVVSPLYKGKKVGIADAIKDMKPNKIFICLGMNEVAGNSAMVRTTKKYSELINIIRKVRPNVKIYIISVTYMTKKAEEPGYYTNNDIKNFNQNIQKFSDAWGVEYIDIANYLADENGNLREDIVSDGLLHFSTDGYRLWEKFFKDYAIKQI